MSLVEPGDEPRERLRYAARAPERELTIDLYQAMWGDAPMLQLRLRWTGLAPDPDDGWRRTLFEVVDARMQLPLDDADALEVATTRKIARGFEGVAGQVRADDRGFDRVAQTRGIPTRPNLDWLLDLAAVPLPEEPVGIGAVWTSARHFDEQVEGFDIGEPPSPTEPAPLTPIVETHRYTELRRYALQRREDSTLVIEVEANLTPDDPARASSSRGTATLELDLADPLPRSATIELIETAVVPGVDRPTELRFRFVFGPATTATGSD